MSDYTGHTPGPWEWTRRFGDYIALRGDNYAPVIERDTPEGPSPDTYLDINEADARLIAAAPELLAENKRLREALWSVIRAMEREANLDFNLKRCIGRDLYEARTTLKHTGGQDE